MNKASVSANGAVVYWNIGACSREKIGNLFDRFGWQKYTPNIRTNEAALQTALLELYAGPTVEIQKHKNTREHGYEVVDVARQEKLNKYDTRFCVRVDAGNRVECWNGGFGQQDAIQNEFDKQKYLLTGQTITGSLVELLGAELSGVRLRPSGGIYWIPADSLDRWIELGNGIEEAAFIRETTNVYWVTTVMDASTIRAVKDAITEEVTSAATMLTKEIVEGNLGEVAIETRKQRALVLRERVGTYSAILGEALQTLQDVVTVAEQAAASALAVQQSADTFQGIM